MAQQETPLTPSWLLLLRNLAVAAGCGVGGYFLVQTSEIVLIILGGCMLIAAPVMLAMPLFMGLPGRGACPACGGTIETGTASESNLLCRGCNGYFDAGQGKLKPSDPQRVAPEPTFAAPTPWDDLTNIVFPTIAFSAADKIQDMLTTKGGGTRVMEARWPAGCSVCGRTAVRFDTAMRRIAKPGTIIDTEIVLLAKDVPYCAEHKDGVKFDRVSSATPGADGGFGVFFRSLAYRNAFLAANPWRFVWRDRV